MFKNPDENIFLKRGPRPMKDSELAKPNEREMQGR